MKLRLASTLAAVALVATSLVGGGTPAAAAPPSNLGGTIGSSGQTAFTPGRYIVTLADKPVATYDGGVRGFDATTPEKGEQLNPKRQAVQEYDDYLVDTQREVAASVGAEIDASYTLATNGFSADLTVEQLAALSANKMVASLVPDELKQVTEVQRSTEFLGLEGENGVWAATGGAETAGEGVVVGVLDTGIAPENPAFAGEPLGTTAGPEPYREGDAIVYAKSDGGTFRGACETGEQFTADDCNTKVITARYFVAGFGAVNLGGTDLGEYVSPRDGDGHGSHTASTAAGNLNTPANVAGQDFGTFSGVAPAAKIAAYKVCWTGPDPADTADDGCTTTDLLSAIDQAVADSVDVINFSIGGGSAQSTAEPTDLAFLGAAAAGIFVAASAGNAGPGATTLDNASPWITTVAASTIPNYEATVELGNGEQFVGASATVDRTEGAEPVSGPLAAASDLALPGAEQANLCLAGTLDPALTAGKIVVCERGVSARVDKSAEVARAGGIGVVLVNVDFSSTDLDTHIIPTVHLDADAHDAVLAYAATPDATATLLPGNLTGVETPTPQVAGFSSRGPIEVDGSDIIKPDITAPGVGILAATANPQDGEPTYAFLSGTSMSSPHIAGLAALYLGERPTATPAEIKSAFMTTAYNTVDREGAPVTDPFTQGAGHVDPTEFFEPGLLYLNDTPDWLSYLEGAGYDVLDPAVEPIDPSDLNLASIGVGSLTGTETITRSVTSTQAGTFTAAINIPGIQATVEPSTLTFAAAGETQTFTITVTRTDAPLDVFSTGFLTWTSGYTEVRSPIAIRPVTIVAPDDVTGEGVSGAVDVTVTPGGTGEIPLQTTGLTPGILHPDPTGVETEHSGSGTNGDSFTYDVTVAEGAEYARFDLDSIDDTADLDLVVYQLNADGVPIAGWQSASGAADERVNLVDPAPGAYRAIASVYAANPPTAFDFTSYVVVPGGAPLALDPSVLPGVQGEPVTYTASWAGLEPYSRYLGLIEYGKTGEFTVLQVTTAEGAEPEAPVNTAPPTISGEPVVGATLTASPGEWDSEDLEFSYQWQADGVDIEGATGAEYTVRPEDAGAAISVVVTASAAERPSGTATSEQVVIAHSSTTKLSLSSSIGFSWQRITARVTVASGAESTEGTVIVRVDGRQVASTPLEADGSVNVRLPRIRFGAHKVQAEFVPADSGVVTGSDSNTRRLWILF
ncbi:S8 family serine peptidase [Salinibacterium sp. SYSU T00001]|uniref:S8 family serine peptidase n=1 Tax=Homoserinimonas sedimenticola TaxID=2986805 RepID=UPI00223658CF|nr:S8 family serine peptidase [Salinibacterium sedimenticola]MCW4386069.1 S8 family serine peptidase [Salinibacterium sedimenticola]